VEASLTPLLGFIMGLTAGPGLMGIGDEFVHRLINWGEEADFDAVERLACLAFYAASWLIFFVPFCLGLWAGGAPPSEALSTAALWAALCMPFMWLTLALAELAINGREEAAVAIRFGFYEGFKIVLGLRRPRRRDP
jgi:hypothetical protein